MSDRPRRAATVAGRERTRAWYAYMAGRSTSGPDDGAYSSTQVVGGGGGTAWTALELKLLHEGYAIFGNRWGLVAEHVGTRSYSACKTYYDRHIDNKKGSGSNSNTGSNGGMRASPAARSIMRSGKKPSTPLIRPTVNHDNDSLNDEVEAVHMNKMPPAVTNIAVPAGILRNKVQEGRAGTVESDDDEEEAKTTSKESKKLCRGCEAKCDSCDVVGTSSKLIEYFEGVRTKKIDFHQRWRSSKRSNNQKRPETGIATTPFFDYLKANKEFIDALVQKEYDDMKKGKERRTKNNKACSLHHVKASELSPLVVQQVVQSISPDAGHPLIADPSEQLQQNEASDAVDTNTPTMTEEEHSSTASPAAADQTNENIPSDIDTSVNNVNNIDSEPFADSSAQILNVANEDIDASFFVGKPIRVFCKTENAYHTGRIVDWRCQAPIREASNYNLDLSATRGKKRQRSVLDVAPDEPSRKGRRKKRGRPRNERKYAGDGSVIEFYDKLLRAREQAKSGADGDFFGRVSAVTSGSENHRDSSADGSMALATNEEDNISMKVPSNHAEYLVRFKAGMDGRKVAVHMWIVLEEHALSVGVGTVWGYIGKDDLSVLSSVPTPKEKWRPAMLHLRSSLEMAPMTELNAHLFEEATQPGTDKAGPQSNTTEPRQALDTAESSSDPKPPLRSLCLFFGKTSVISVLSVKDACVDFFSSDFQTTSASSALIAAGLPPPSHSTSLAAKLVEKSKAVATTMACMEMHEQRRLRQWHKLEFLKCASACNVDVIPLAVSSGGAKSKDDFRYSKHQDIVYVARDKSKGNLATEKKKRSVPNVPLLFWTSLPKCNAHLEKEYICSF